MEGTEMDTNDPMIRRVKALLMKAEAVAGTPEADAFNEKAIELMAKFGIDQALLAARGEIQDKIVSKRFEIPELYALDRRQLLVSIVLGLGGRCVLLANYRPGTYQGKIYAAHVYAFESDMARIEMLYELLSAQMLLGAAAARVPYGENKRSYRKSWMVGFSQAIYGRLNRNEKQAAKDAGTGTDLVLFDRRTAVERAYETAHPRLGKATPRKLGGSGRGDGYFAGTRASLGDNHVTSGSRPALVG